MKYILFGIIFLIGTPFIMQSQEISESQIDSIKKVILYTNTLNNKGEYTKAIESSKLTLDFIEQSERFELIGNAYNSLAFSYAELKDKEKAFKYSFKARDYFLKSKDTLSIIMIYNDIGVTYEDFGMINEANKAYKQALEIGSFYKPHTYIIYPYTNLGKNLIEYSKDYKLGLQYLDKALDSAKELKLDEKNNHTYADIYLSFAYAFHKLKRFEESEMYFQKAINLAINKKYLHSIEQIFRKRTKLYKEDRNYKAALGMMDKYILIKDSISKMNNLEVIKTIEAKYKIKESEEKLSFFEKEKQTQEAQLTKSNRYNILLVVLIALLILTAYLIIKKNKELQLARDVAENLSRVKSDFYSEISHELRTPLYAVIELSNILLNENVNDKNKEYLESLKFSGGHLLSLINNVLELNKIESGILNVEEIEFNLKVLITNIIDSLEYALRDSNNQIKLFYDESISNQLVGDSLKLSQLLINLISNAIKFTKNGTIEVEIKQVVKNADNEELYFAIKDDGIGIPLDKQKSIFDDFYQELSRHDNSYKGTGLGLSIVKRLLTVMGSDISIESELNKGAKFYFNLSFKNLDDLKLKETKLQPGIKELKGMRFLVVDDNKINQLVTKKILHQLELECNVVDNGHKAIDAVKENTYDCVLMDLNMPGINGYETTQQIRHFNQDIVIIALTAATSEEVKKKIIFYDMDGYVLKPFYIEELLKTIGNGINNRSRVNLDIA